MGGGSLASLFSSHRAFVENQLKTIGDFVRHAEEKFETAGLAFGHGVSSAFDEAAFIVLETLKLPVDALEENWERLVDASEKDSLLKIIGARIETRKPAPYLLNRAYLQGVPFYVDERVIAPRSFIGEILCREDGFSRIDYDEIKSIADICCGSGCLAILAAHLFPQAEIDAADISPDALDVARRNVSESGFGERISIHEGDLFAPLKGKKYDLILANPPYVDKAAMDALPPEYRHEPALALAGGADGMDIVRRILAQAPHHIAPGGGLMCEIGRGKDIIEKEYDLPFLWLDTEESEGEVFWIRF